MTIIALMVKLLLWIWLIKKNKGENTHGSNFNEMNNEELVFLHGLRKLVAGTKMAKYILNITDPLVTATNFNAIAYDFYARDKRPACSCIVCWY